MKLFTMTRTVTRNLARGPATLMYPTRPRVYPGITRGRIENSIEKCIFCGQCGRRCPTSAIEVARERREWQIDRLKCCACNLCVEICPVKSLSTASEYAPPVTARALALQLLTASAATEGEATPRGET